MEKNEFEQIKLQLNELAWNQQKTAADLTAQITALQQNAAQAANDIMRLERELYYAHLVHDAIVQSSWLKDKTLNLFGWAANYGFIYALYRILDKVKPMNILEMGVGQTTNLTSQYAAYHNPKAKLIVCEHDAEWFDRYKPELPKTPNIELRKFDLESFDYENQTNYKYAGLVDAVSATKFDLIIIDGPIGNGFNLPRANILDLIDSDCLADDFVIIFDDAERYGEQNTIAAAEQKLRDKGIEFAGFIRSALKMQYFIVSKSREFIQYL